MKHTIAALHNDIPDTVEIDLQLSKRALRPRRRLSVSPSPLPERAKEGAPEKYRSEKLDETGRTIHQSLPPTRYRNANVLAAESFKSTLKFAQVLGVLLFYFVLTRNMNGFTSTPVETAMGLEIAMDGQELAVGAQGNGAIARATQKRDKPASNISDLSRVEGTLSTVSRTETKPSRYVKPIPSLKIPESLESFLQDITEPKSEADVPLFWHILKSGGTTIKDAAGMCLGKVEASESGVLDGHIGDQTLDKVTIGQGSIEYINVDTTTPKGISRAKAMGLVQSEMADVIFSSLLHESVQLFNTTEATTKHKGRAFCLFRHPIDRAISLFHYLKHAPWEPTFSRNLEKIETIEDYAISKFAEENWMTRFLTNEMVGRVTENHLNQAKEILRRKFIVGLTIDMENSFDRFMRYLNWDKGELSEDQRSCVKKYLSVGSNRNTHKLVKEGSPGWKILRGNNLLDLELYDYVLQLYEEQGKMLQ